MREFFGYCFTWACCPLKVRRRCLACMLHALAPNL
jgi:hypothetical protein